MNEELKYYADNSLSAALNWIYAPDNHTDHVNYVLFYPTNREELSLDADIPVRYDFLAGSFEGNTSQAVVIYYAPPKCLRLLDPEIDPVNHLIPEDTLLRDAAMLSSTAPVLNEAASRMPDIYGSEPVHGWCYYFEKADLARQMGNWTEVVSLGDTAFQLNDYPNDPIERFVFIEGYAHVGQWQEALKLSTVSYQVSRNYVGPLLCILWERIGRQTDDTPEQKVTQNTAKDNFDCRP